jgi:hypothetical protein
MELHSGLCLMLDIFMDVLSRYPEAEVDEILDKYKDRL